MASDPTAAISPDQLAAVDQWHARHSANVKGLMAAARADIAREHPVSRAVEAAMLSAVIRSHPTERDGLADLLAVIIVDIVRGGHPAPEENS